MGPLKKNSDVLLLMCFFSIRSFAPLVMAVTAGLVNYWPVKSGVMADLVGNVSTTSAGSPQFTADRFGNANDAILVNSGTSVRNLPDGVYLFGDYTITAWVRNLACNWNWIGLCHKSDPVIFLAFI
jgi:hypothetical protein